MRDKPVALAYDRAEVAYLLVVQALDDLRGKLPPDEDVIRHLTQAACSLEAARLNLKRRRN